MTDHPEIPPGCYCYTYVDDKRVLCPHWKKTEAGATCQLLQLNSVEYEPHNLIWDQVKECGINDED